jgi:DHA1 family tetracycline resistance protein-like MFS transporter
MKHLSIFFFVSVFLDLTSVAIVVPLLASFCRHLGISRSLLGVVQSIYGIMQLISTPVLGTLSDKIGRRPVLMISLLGTSLSFAILAWAVMQKSIPLFFLSRFVLGGCRQTMSVGAALISEVYTDGAGVGEERRKALGKGLSRFQFSTASAFVVGPAIGSFLAGQFGLLEVVVIASLLAFVNAALMFVVVPTPTKVETPVTPSTTASPGMRSSPLKLVWRILKERTPYSYLLFVLYTFSFSVVMTQSTIPTTMWDIYRAEAVHSITVTEASAGWVIALLGGFNSLAQVVIPILLRRTLSANIATWAMIGACFCYFLQATASTVPHLLLGVITAAFCAGFTDTVNKSTFSSKFSSSMAGEVMSVVYSIDGFNRISAPVVGGLLSDLVGISGPGWACFTTALIATVLYLRFVRAELLTASKKE